MDKYKEFLKIARELNAKLNVIPVLYGSLGLGLVLQKDLKPQDTDILVPKIYLKNKWEDLKKILSELDYNLMDEKEHAFNKAGNIVAFAEEEDLINFADVDYKRLEIISTAEAKYKILSIDEYSKIYNKSKDDSYRKNNKKDLAKITLINSQKK